MEKIVLFLMMAGAFSIVGTSARGLQAVQAIQQSQPQTGDPNNGFTLQSGYEGYLLSPQKGSNAIGAWSELWSALAKIGFLKGSKSLLVPLSTFALLHGVKILKWIVKIAGLLAIGTLLAIPICTFTSFCTISLAKSPFSFIQTNAVKEQLSEFARNYMSPEKLEIASRLVQSALETYNSNSNKLSPPLPESNTAESQSSSSQSSPSEQNEQPEQPDQEQNETHLD